ncbi:cytochrome-c peroxidase [Tropicibacter sp. S64]|uniref:cytochrome-c peroxidase n=1 Tax=Tropicibacter sp. S64 TaxID=3415122 RepID=UPI003C79F105
MLKLAALLSFLALPALAQNWPAPLTDADFPEHSPEEVRLGQQLFWDAELSGNRNISCATCHHPRFGTSDGLSLGMGEGGIGLGPERRADPGDLPEQRIPRNAPALWNVGAKGFTVMFHDGRIEVDPSRPTGFRTPLEDDMAAGFASLLSAQTMFPVLSPDEMAGHYQENEISRLVRQGRLTGEDGAWAAISARIAALPEYQVQFEAVYPEIAAGRPIAFTDISNAIAAYMTFDFRSDSAPFDAALRGEEDLPPEAQAGAKLFYGEAGCSACHAGPLLTDMKFHAMGDPQIGPGKAERFESHQRDIGRQRVTGRVEDAFAFRTPSLRNVTLTAPYGHAGGVRDLRTYLAMHASGGAALAQYDIRAAVLAPLDLSKPDLKPDAGGADFAAIQAAARSLPALEDRELDALLAFLAALEDPIARAGGRMGIPDTVPSGLPVER